MMHLLVGALVVVTTLAQSEPSTSCPEVKNGPQELKTFDGSCFQFVEEPKKDFKGAEEFCKSNGGLLAMPKTREIENFIYDTFEEIDPKIGQIWIGLDDRKNEGNYTWADGTFLNKDDYSFWGAGNGFRASFYGKLMSSMIQDCVSLDAADNGQWKTNYCSHPLFFSTLFGLKTKSFVCQYD